MKTSHPEPHALKPVTPEEHRALGLLPGWEFFHAAGIVIDRTCMCGRPIVYAYRADGDGGMCAKHARDF